MERINNITSRHFVRGLGYSPGSGPPYGSRAASMSTFFGDPVLKLLPNDALGKPNRWAFGSSVSVRDPLSNIPQPGYPNMRTFPQPGAFPGEVGPGNIPGGNGEISAGVPYPGVPLAYWANFGVSKKTKKQRRVSKKRSRKKNKRRGSKKTKKQRRVSKKRSRKK